MKVVDKKPEEDQKLDQKDKGKEGKQYEVSASQFSRLIFAWMSYDSLSINFSLVEIDVIASVVVVNMNVFTPI